MKRILISGYHGLGNCGDEAILVAMVNNLKHVYPELDIVALSKKPQETRRVYGIHSISRVNIIGIIYQLLRSNILLSGGGSLLQDVTSTRSLIYYLTIIMLAKILKKPVMLYANGVGPIKKKLNRKITKYVLNKVDIITLRDEESKVFLRKIGVTVPELIVTADPVFTLDAIDSRAVKKILNYEKIDLKRPLVGISIREWKTNVAYEKTIAEIADNIVEKYNHNILFVPMHMPNDLKIIRNVQSLMRNRSYTIRGRYSVREYMGIISSLNMMISMRLHTLIFAAVEKVPMIGLVYDPKVSSFLDLVQQPSGGDISNIDVKKIYELIKIILANKERMSKSIESHIDELRKRAEINDEIVIKLLEKY